ncbi:alpha-L-arabinofuranosidase C-terminal domain-containing protein [Flavobacterium sp. KACC 22761]|uniref:alpha-L-arabinofuranosidase C-terminal domain-containing protein n=1 Tax=Flavobacterium sp. KACC 22761 TaxID=3092665 RepID=UPI002A74FF9A|nr:alpha-L-arabinofuranosidase C-terminal domain-containing protein [Flavobacterium sp. KACC 22761]WPO77864.1 alpha-L-arabinofuranosidase C-terminal domain-containing protein [Flavobacterium sp. KACC 22761]
MKTNIITRIMVGGLLLNCIYGQAQKTSLEVDLKKTTAKIQPTMFGLFFEDINFAADGGLYAEMIKNRSFEFDKPLMGWEQPNTKRSSMNLNSGVATPIKALENKNNTNFCRILVNDPKGYEIINEGFRGMGVKKNAKYNLSLKAANHSGAIKKIIFQFIDKDQKVIGETSIIPISDEWKNYTAQLTATQTEAKAKFRITFEGSGTIDLDMISVFPEDTWMNRKNGLRKDLVQLLYDIKPGFLRFPGGCIVEGRTLADRYQWKNSIGNIEERSTRMNRWNVEFGHKQTPDYFQSFGLGFFEYFQLSEDIGATPLPILSCGMACQYNTGELAQMEELDPYVQDALDLIEFANGSATTSWGKLRVEMGHPKPFNLKYIGVGNEQWGPAYIERYKVFEKAIKDKYPNITIVSGSGPSPSGEFFDFGMNELKKLNAELIDEHYYESPKWFRENATRYDKYDRKGPKIFAGEYAAQSVSGANPNNRNNWECAFSEAAFITGLERNAEVVNLTSYAPLMAHEDAWQWTPDMIWFNNLESYGSANYYVQKIFSTNKGTDLLNITKDGKPVTGENNLYASAVKDSNTKEIILKLVNTSSAKQELSVDLKGEKLASAGKIITLSSPNLQDENTFANPKKIYPIEGEYKLKNQKVEITLSAYSLTVLKLKLIEK